MLAKRCLWFREHGLELPEPARATAKVAWRRPRYATIHRMITNPIYGGAYAYGKDRRHRALRSASGARAKSRRKPRGEWLVHCSPGAHEGYLDWERAEAIRRMVQRQCPDQPASRRCPTHGDALARGPRSAVAAAGAQADRSATRGANHNIPRYSLPPGPGSTMASRAASPLAACGSTTPLKRRS